MGCRRTLGGNDETTTLGSSTVDGFDDVNQLKNEGKDERPDQRLDTKQMGITHLLFVIHCPVTEAVEDERLAMWEVLKERQDVHLIVVTSPKINHNVLVPGILQVSDHPPPTLSTKDRRTDRRT